MTAKRGFLVMLAGIFLIGSGYSWLSIKDGIVILSPTQSIDITIVSIMDALVSTPLENGEFWVSIIFSAEDQSWTCISNHHKYMQTSAGILERGGVLPTSIKEPKVSLFDVLTLARLQTPKTIVAVYLCSDLERDYWRVLTDAEVFSIDTEKPIVFRKEKLIKAPESNASS